jgi:hypothetical protein
MLGVAGALRVSKQDRGILKQQKSKLNLNQQAQMREEQRTGFQNSGLVSTVAMSSVQGMQLVNPHYVQ